MAKAKQLNVSQLQDEISIYDEYVEFPVTVQGEEYMVKMYPYFKPEKVRDLVNDLFDFLKSAETEKLIIPKVEEDDLVGYFIIKYFTDMKFTKSKKAKVIYNEFKLALNSQLFKVLMESYPKESIQSVFDRIFGIISADTELKNRFTEMQHLVDDLQLENREIFENMNTKVVK